MFGLSKNTYRINKLEEDVEENRQLIEALKDCVLGIKSCLNNLKWEVRIIAAAVVFMVIEGSPTVAKIVGLVL